MARTVTRKRYNEILKDFKERFGEIAEITNDDGTQTLMILGRNKHAGTFEIKGE